MKSGRTPVATSALNMPTWTAPKLPPPENTKAVFELTISVYLGATPAAWSSEPHHWL